MTRVAEDGTVVIEATPPDTCETCGQTRELRPYGPNGERICFQCATSTPEMQRSAEQRFAALIGADAESVSFEPDGEQ